MLLDAPLRETTALMHRRIGKTQRYMGIHTMKCPEDFWTYQEIVNDTKPDFIVEIGNFCGGALLAYAHLLDAFGHGTVIGVDVTHEFLDPRTRAHPRIRLVTGDAARMAPEVARIVAGGTVLVIEDSSHTYENTLAVLRAYSPLVHPGHYIVVEDGIYGNGVQARGGDGADGASAAAKAFLAENPGFVADEIREWPVTWNPGGFLRRAA